MNSRKVILGSRQAKVLFGVEWLVNASATQVGLKEVDYSGIFYACMIQAGIDKVEIFSDSTPNSDSELIRQRKVIIPESIWNDTYDKLRDTFEQFVEHPLYVPTKLLVFLTDLMQAIERKSSLVITGPVIPDITELERIFPPELFIPLKNFLGTIESDSADLPLPKDFISKDNFNRLQDIILSDLFSHYSSSHKAFEDGRVLKLHAIKSVEKAGWLLLDRNQKYLKAQRLAVSLIPVTSKIIDAVFGRLPGILADFFGEQLSGWLKDDRRIVIYRFDPLFLDLVTKHRAMIRQRIST
jgi:hypothetical protein